MVTGGAICSTAGAIAPPVNMLDEALVISVNPFRYVIIHHFSEINQLIVAEK